MKLASIGKLVGCLSHPRRARLLLSALRGLPYEADRDEVHLRAAVGWLCRAQDVTGVGGISSGYSLLTGWLPPYPETTGYCIPTFLAYARYADDDTCRKRARLMAEWELLVQDPDGGIPGDDGRPHAPGVPVSFDTGQVLQGWCAVFREAPDSRFLEAASRAGNWLLRTQQTDGAWRDKPPGRHTFTTFTFNTRTAWALLDLWSLTAEASYREAALRHLDWVLQQRESNGWFRLAGFGPNELPLTHTLAYLLEGLLGCWQITREPRLLEAVTGSTTHLLKLYQRHSVLLASVDARWKLVGRSACVTGCAQIALVWFRLARATNDAVLAHAARRLLDQIKRWQFLRADDPELIGALPGSMPIYGQYEPLRCPNWGVKFLCDALLAAADRPRRKT